MAHGVDSSGRAPVLQCSPHGDERILQVDIWQPNVHVRSSTDTGVHLDEVRGCSCAQARLQLTDSCATRRAGCMYSGNTCTIMSTIMKLAASCLHCSCRSMPYKRSLAALITVSSTSLLAMVRWLYGTWLPDAHTLITSRPFLCYLGISALLGWGVTYWFDDTSNVKLNTSIRVVLQIAGLSMVYNSVSDEYVAISAVALLLSSKVLWTIGR